MYTLLGYSFIGTVTLSQAKGRRQTRLANRSANNEVVLVVLLKSRRDYHSDRDSSRKILERKWKSKGE
jgi:hypothetical protein